MAPAVCAMADASITASTGTPKVRATSADDGVPSINPHAFDQDHVRLLRRLRQLAAALVRTDHPGRACRTGAR